MTGSDGQRGRAVVEGGGAAWSGRSGREVVLAYRVLGLGDLLAAVPALRALRDAFPSSSLVLVTSAWLEPLVRAAGLADEVLPADALAPLDVAPPEVAVNLHGRGPQSHEVLLGCRPGRLVAFAQPQLGVDGPAWRSGEHEVARWCRLLTESGVPADRDRLDLDLAEPGPGESPGPIPADARPGGITIVHPGASSGARRWPVERFAEVAGAERERGRRVLVTGSGGERDLAERVARSAGLDRSAVLAGRTDLLGLARVVAAAGRVVCGDTGMAHLATALRTPSVVLFGPVSPLEWGPPVERPWHRVLWAGTVGDPHATRPDPGLLRIDVVEVLDALAEIDEPSVSGAPGASPGTAPGSSWR